MPPGAYGRRRPHFELPLCHGIRADTAKAHVKAPLAKLNVRTRTQPSIVATQRGLLSAC